MRLSLYFDQRLRLADDVILLPLAEKRTHEVDDGDSFLIDCFAGKLKLTVGTSFDGRAYVSKPNYYAINQRKPHITTLGCDPEFVLMDPLGRVCRADSLFPKWGKIGHDGPLAELRPDPASQEEQVVANLHKLIRQLPQEINKKLPVPGALEAEAHSEKNNNAMGFHIHLGAPKVITSFSTPGAKQFIDSFITALDYFVGIPALLLEDSSVRRLGNGEYGKAGDWRIGAFGKTIEYRTPGGFHLRHPVCARGILGLALCAAQNIFSYMERRTLGWSQLSPLANFPTLQSRFGLPSQQSIKDVFGQPGKAAALKLLPPMVKSLQTLETYQAHKVSIEGFIGAIASNSKFSPRLRDNW